jgi:Fur family ferric uptake transcriptional regulator
LAVLQALRGAPSPVSHGEVADQLSSFGWDRTTIYRNLLDLTRVGLARRIDLGDHIWRFEPTGATNAPEGLRWRFVCTDCGDVQELGGLHLIVDQSARVPKAVRRKSAEMQVRGVCDTCTTTSTRTAEAQG